MLGVQELRLRSNLASINSILSTTAHVPVPLHTTRVTRPDFVALQVSQRGAEWVDLRHSETRRKGTPVLLRCWGRNTPSPTRLRGVKREEGEEGVCTQEEGCSNETVGVDSKFPRHIFWSLGEGRREGLIWMITSIFNN